MRFFKFSRRIVHDRLQFIDQGFGQIVIQVFSHLIDLSDRRSLGFGQKSHVVFESHRKRRTFLAADDSPRRVDDFFLQFCQFHCLLSPLTLLALLLLLLLLLLLSAFGLKEDLFEPSNFREKHITLGATGLAIRPDVFRPKMPRHKLIRLSVQRLKFQQVIQCVPFLAFLIFGDFKFLNVAATDRPCEPRSQHAKVIQNPRTHRNFFQRRNRNVTGRFEQFQLRRLVCQCLDRQPRRRFVFALLRVDEVQSIFFGSFDNQVRFPQQRIGRVLGKLQLRTGFSFGPQRGRRDFFVQIELQFRVGSNDG